MGGLSYQNLHHNEVGQWIEWAGETLPADQAKAQIGPLMQDWIENVYQAAGTWLAKAPAGPTKEAGISAYAVAVSHYEPETAAQWALTLPPGKERDQTLRQIYQNWPTTDSAGKEAAEAFKVEHGIKGFREP